MSNTRISIDSEFQLVFLTVFLHLSQGGLTALIVLQPCLFLFIFLHFVTSTYKLVILVLLGYHHGQGDDWAHFRPDYAGPQGVGLAKKLKIYHLV